MKIETVKTQDLYCKSTPTHLNIVNKLGFMSLCLIFSSPAKANLGANLDECLPFPSVPDVPAVTCSNFPGEINYLSNEIETALTNINFGTAYIKNVVSPLLFYNFGLLINQNGSTLLNSGSLDNNATLNNYGTINNYGLVNNGGTLFNSSLINNQSGYSLQNMTGGSLTNSYSGQLNNQGFLDNMLGAILTNNGALINSNSGSFDNEVMWLH